MNQPMEHPIVATALSGNADALEFVRRVALILHTHDDAIDRDVPLSDADLNAAFVQALVDLPRNRFYREHFDLLNAILLNAIMNWRIANELERQQSPSEDDLRISFVVRSSYVDLVGMCAIIIGGLEWAVRCGVELRRWAHAEGYERYVENLAAEKAAREVHA